MVSWMTGDKIELCLCDTLKLRHKDGRVFGVIERSKPTRNLIAPNEWHYHETNGEPHCTRTLLASDVEVVK